MHLWFHHLAISGLFLTILPAQTAPDLASQPVPLRGGGEAPADFGRLAVPEHRGKKAARPISLAFLRVRSPLGKPGAPVFLLAGGPGGSSIELVHQLMRGGGKVLLEMFGGDLVAIDQRGVGQSTPNLESATRYGFDELAPGDPAAMLEVIRRVGREEAARWRANGVDLAGYTTVESADDIDAVRAALGYDQIALWGMSYGTHLALATLRRHAAHIARAVLIVPEGPDHTIKLPSYAQEGLSRLATLVRDDPTFGAQLPDLVGTVAKILDGLARAPVYVEIDGDRVGVSKFDVQQILANEIGLVRRHLEQVPAMVLAMAKGDFAAIARRLREERREAGVGSAMQVMMDSASGLSAARAKVLAREVKETLLGDAVNFPFPHVAEAWDAPDLGDEFRGPLRSDVPVLILAGDLDSRTPVRNARELMQHLPNAHLIEVENAGHDLNWMQPELREAWRDFLAGAAVKVTRVVAPKPQFAAR